MACQVARPNRLCSNLVCASCARNSWIRLRLYGVCHRDRHIRRHWEDETTSIVATKSTSISANGWAVEGGSPQLPHEHATLEHVSE